MAKKVLRWRLRQLRLQKSAEIGVEVTQQEVADFVGVDSSAISRMENNKYRAVTLEIMEKLVEFYSLDSTNDLLQIEEQIRQPYPSPALQLA